jgi:NAD(P)H-dependent FMN reductase
MSKPKIAVIIGSIRPTRQADKPAKWLAEQAKAYGAFDVELVDLKDYPLPLFDAPTSDLWMPTPNAMAAKWQAKLHEFDGFIIVTPEYNRSIPGALKNALDWAYTPFVKKAVAFVSYGSVGGARAVEHLRNILVEMQTVSVRHTIHIGGSDFAPVIFGQKTFEEVLVGQVPFSAELLDNLAWWTRATKAARDVDLAASGNALSAATAN